jgi:hypothetical protein
MHTDPPGPTRWASCRRFSFDDATVFVQNVSLAVHDHRAGRDK